VAQRGTAEPLKATAPKRRGHFDDPQYYDKAYRSLIDDVAFYCALASRHGGPVLEYGVGNGRVALALARAGIDVVGVDASRPMLADLRAKLRHEPDSVRKRMTVLAGDMREKRFARRFQLVIAPFNVVLHLMTERDLGRFLKRVQAHLTTGGRFVFDFSVPHGADLGLAKDRWYGAPRFRDPRTGKLVRYAERFDYDAFTQILRMTFRFSPVDGSPPWETELAHRQWFPQELSSALRHHGFRRQRWTSDFQRRKPEGDADSLVVECRPEPRRKVL
jgi:SAM-dependent methyltransferase